MGVKRTLARLRRSDVPSPGQPPVTIVIPDDMQPRDLSGRPLIDPPLPTTPANEPT